MRKHSSKNATHVLLVSHDLSRSGAPRIVFEMAKIFRDHGASVTVVSPVDGPFLPLLQSLDVVVVLESRALQPNFNLISSLKTVPDFAICNTVVTAAAVKTLRAVVPTYWYIHEISLLAELLGERPELREILNGAAGVWTGSELPAALIRPVRTDVQVLPYGMPQIALNHSATPGNHEGPAQIGIFGSVEPRKGQDISIAAMKLLSQSGARTYRLSMHGRVLDHQFYESLRLEIQDMPHVVFLPELDEVDYSEAIVKSDIVLVSSRDDTMPIVALDALGAGRILVCTPTTGIAGYLEDRVNGFISEGADAFSLATTLASVIDQRKNWATVSKAAQELAANKFTTAVFSCRLFDAVDWNFEIQAAL